MGCADGRGCGVGWLWGCAPCMYVPAVCGTCCQLRCSRWHNGLQPSCPHKQSQVLTPSAAAAPAVQVTPHPRHLASLAQQTPGAALEASGDEEVMAEQQEREADMAAAAAQGYPLLSPMALTTLVQHLQVGKLGRCHMIT